MERQENMGKDGLLHCSVCGEPTQKILPFPLMDGSEGTRDIESTYHVFLREERAGCLRQGTEATGRNEGRRGIEKTQPYG